MTLKKRCPECGGKMVVEETAITGTRMPLVCQECGHVDLIVEEEEEDDFNAPIIKEKPKEKSKIKKIKPKTKRMKKK